MLRITMTGREACPTVGQTIVLCRLPVGTNEVDDDGRSSPRSTPWQTTKNDGLPHMEKSTPTKMANLQPAA